MVEIGICDDCKDPAVKVRGITRHLHKDSNGLQYYSNKCMTEGCMCERAAMSQAKLAVTEEKAKWGNIMLKVFG